MQTVKRLLSYLPRGNTLDDAAWARRHLILKWLLGLHIPVLAAFGIFLGWGWSTTGLVLIPVAVCLGLGQVLRSRRPAEIAITGGLTYCSAALVGLTYGSIEAHFHFFIIIGFIALYQDWVPFLWNVLFTVLSHGIGSLWQSNLIFNHAAGQQNPWFWSAIHGVAVLIACVGMVIFWRANEDEQRKREQLAKQLADAEIGRRRLTSDLLVNLARRNQSMLYRQLDIINQLEEKERDPDALAELFRLDHLATRVRRNAESLLVLSGEQPTRVWSAAVPLRDVVRAAIAETEDLERVMFAIDENLNVAGHTVTDLTHLIAELTENAVRYSPPHASVSIRTRPYLHSPGACLLTIEDWGVGMPMEEIAAANELFAHPPEVDLAVAQRLGFHVVARLAQRHAIGVSLTPTPGCGITAVIVLPGNLFDDARVEPQQDAPAAHRPDADRRQPAVAARPAPERAAPAHALREPAVPDHALPDHAAPTHAVPDHAVPTHAVPAHAVLTHAVPNHLETAPHGVPMIGTGTPPLRTPMVVATLRQPQRPAPDAGESEARLPADSFVANGTPGADDSFVGWWRATTPEHAGPPDNVAGEPIRPVNAAGPSAPAAAFGPGAVPAQRSASDSIPGPNTGNGTGADAEHRPDGTENPPDPDGGEQRSGQVPGQRLNRRVPQSHLAPELRSASQPAPTAPPGAHARQASDALSRYQASRQAAQAEQGLAPDAVHPAGNGAVRRGDNGGRQ